MTVRGRAANVIANKRLPGFVRLANCRRVGDWRGSAVTARFQSPPVKPCMRFSRTRLTDVLHRRCSAFPRQSRKGLGGMTVRWRLARPR